MSESVASTSDERRPWARAAAWLAFLGPFFFATYGFATWLSSERADVGAIVFDWERAIPFVPWTIVPYWAIDAIYALSLFACANRRELDMHAKRLLTAQVIAVTMFVLFPLRFTFDRPDVEGVFGWMFRLLATFDKPYNQAPSLHIALLVVLWALIVPKTTGIGRWLAVALFLLIGVSVLTTWQHHFIDVPTGALVGFFCVWLWPRDAPSPLARRELTSDRQRIRMAVRYSAGAVVAAAIAVAVGGPALWLFWVTAALALVAINYAFAGPAGFQKRNGSVSPAAAVLLAPYLLGAKVNAWAWTRRRPSPDHIGDNVWIGRLPSRSDIERGGFDGIVDLTCELSMNAGGCSYSNPAVLDLTVPDRATLAAAVRAIEARKPGAKVLVCCALGYSRSAVVAAAWLNVTGRAPDADSAIARVRALRPEIILTDAHRALIAT